MAVGAIDSAVSVEVLDVADAVFNLGPLAAQLFLKDNVVFKIVGSRL